LSEVKVKSRFGFGIDRYGTVGSVVEYEGIGQEG